MPNRFGLIADGRIVDIRAGYVDGYKLLPRGVGLGWYVSGDTFAPTRPSEAVQTGLDELALKRAFTQTERLAIRAARETDPVVDDAMDLMEATFRAGGLVQKNDPDFQSALLYFEQIGVLAPGRAREIGGDT